MSHVIAFYSGMFIGILIMAILAGGKKGEDDAT